MGAVRRCFSQCPQENTNVGVIQKRLQHRCFPMNIAKYLRIAFL